MPISWKQTIEQALGLRPFRNKQNSHNKVIANLAKALSKNDIKALKLLGFDHSRQFRNSDVRLLCRALEANSSLQYVSIGWSLQESTVSIILNQVAKLPQLQTLVLVTLTWIQESAFSLVLLHCKSLQKLECQGVRIRTDHGQDINVVDALSRTTLSSLTSHLTTLKLIQCGIRDGHCRDLVRCLQCLNIHELSLQGNDRLTSTGLVLLVQSRIRRLDLTECAITAMEAFEMGQGIPKAQWLQELILIRNYKLSSCSSRFLDFCNVSLIHLKYLDISLCNLTEDHLARIFRLLQNTTCQLESFVCEGKFQIPLDSFGEVVSKNTSLTTLVVKSTRSDCIAIPLEWIRTKLEQNYRLQHLQIDCREPPNTPESMQARAYINFLLCLNRAGRKILMQDHCLDGGVGEAAWCQLLARSSNQVGILYWLIRNGITRLLAS